MNHMAVQESLEGTQAEADALIEESSYWVINTNDDEGHEERAWGALVTNISQSTFATVAAALGQPFSSWAKTKVVLPYWTWTMPCFQPCCAAIQIPRIGTFYSIHTIAAFNDM